MSIKKLFGSADGSRNYLAETNQKNLFKDVESSKNIEQLATKQETFVPQIDYSQPDNFAKFGSAYYYYSGAFGRIIDYYPYDGSYYEQNEFYNKSLDVEKYIFNNLFPRTNGYANFNSSSYIDLKGGPHGVTYDKASELFDNPLDSKRMHANVYDKNIYESAGLPDSYGTGSRESNLRANFNSGVSIEFWLKSVNLATNANSIIFDMWNNNASGSHDMGRMTIEIQSGSSTSPFLFTVSSGSTNTLFRQTIGQNIISTALDDWNHYSFVFENSGSDFRTNFYLNGYLNHTVINSGITFGELPSIDMAGKIGALITAPFRADGVASTRAANTHTFTGSIDEFRYWKAARTADDIGKNWFSQVRGGTNTDINNTTLGVYYKFNEGNSGYGYLDSNVLDYSGRLTNGTWTGTPSRTISSAIVEASAAASEYKDPIIYSLHPDVVNVRQGLFNSGSFHDRNNTSNLKTLIPSWVLEEHEALGNTNVELLTHIMGSYFDKIYNQIEAIPTFKQMQYTSASNTPLPFAEHLPQSLGLYTPQLFVDADVISRFMNKTEDFAFQNDLSETKNLIYQNLYNNLTSIYKTKGTEKTIRNVFRCFNLDDTIIKLRTYADNTVYDLDSRTPRLEQTLANKKALYFNTSSHINGTCFQYQDPDDTTNSRGYISGSGHGGFQNVYGFTAETDFTLPSFQTDYDSVDRNFNQSSIFGMYSASAHTPDTNTSWQGYDSANFQVYVIREEKFSKNAFFMLSSSYYPNDTSGDTPWLNPNAGPFPILTSSVYFGAYDNNDWNISVRLKPSNYPMAKTVSGSDIGLTYDLVFQGINTKLGSIENEFYLTASISKTAGEHFLSGSKRLYVGANRLNFSGTVQYPTDVRMFNTRFWGKYLDDDSIKQHIYDLDNSGISGSFQHLSPLDPNSKNLDLLNRDTLALDWNFSDVTGSDASGQFLTKDMSSGSAQIRSAIGWLGGLSGYLHTGRGHGFKANSSDASKEFVLNTFKFIDPEQPISSDMINILTSDDRAFGFTETVPNFHHTLEKSMYASISDEMLNFFAGAIDFNNIIGEPVNRYRSRYKKIEKLREAFFRRVSTTSDVEKFIEYYQWLDDTLARIIEQLMPASGKFTDDVMNVVESHVLERNKYKSQFPTIEFRLDDPITPIMGINERLYNWKYNHAPISQSVFVEGVGGPLSGSAKQSMNSDWWRDRAERRNSDISTGDEVIDTQRDIIRTNAENDNNQKLNTLSTISDGVHSGSIFVIRKLAKPYKFTAYRTASPVMPIKGGVNFERNKKIDLTYNALRPDGPVNQDGSAYVPENVLYSSVYGTSGEEDETVRLKNTQDPLSKPSDKVRRHVKVQFGRDWEEGIGYQNIKSDISFPFNIISGAIPAGYNKKVVDRVMSGVILTNLHNDVYGPDMESPIQGPFTNYAVGGHQSRHVGVNKVAVGSNFPTGEISMNTITSITNRTVTISDGGTSVEFLFTSSPSNPEDVEIDGDTETTMENLVAAINSYPGFTIKAAIKSSATASLINYVNSPDYSVGNIAITSTGTWMYAISGMAGGVGGLDRWDTRPEAWKILLGKADDPPISGAIGMVGPDYPLANAPEELGQYPHTASQKAVYYRGFTAKRPVNIRNIRHTTGSTILGNYEHNYQVVQAPGGNSNPRQFIEKQPNLPRKIYNNYVGNTGSNPTSVRTLLDIHRGSRDGLYTRGTPGPLLLTGAAAAAEGLHTDFSGDYSTDYLQGGLGYATTPLGGQATTNNSVIISKFSHRGGIEVMTRGYQDFRAGEFSVYNTLNNRNLTVRRPFQSPPIVSGAAESNGIRVYDIHGNDYGLYVHAARHAARFFRDSILVPNNQGATYDEKPSFHRVHRNNLPRPKEATERFVPTLTDSELINDKSLYFTDSENYGHSLINAESASARNFLTGARSRGMTYSGWLRCARGNTVGYTNFFCVGKGASGASPMIEISKVSASLNFYVESRTSPNSDYTAGSGRRGKYTVNTTHANASAQAATINSGSWFHLAVVLPVSGGSTQAPSFPAIYINGVTQSVTESTSPYTYFSNKNTTSEYSYLGSVPRTGDSIMTFGGDSTVTAIQSDAFSGAMDQLTLWDVALSSSEVQALYNGGIPCNITASSVYSNSGSYLFGWYKLGEGNQTDVIKATNPKVFVSGANAIWNSHTAENHFFPVAFHTVTTNNAFILGAGPASGLFPAPLAGCTPVVIGYSSSIVYSCSNFYDNLNHYHQIPRGDRQYAWMTGAMSDTDPCNYRYAGFMPMHGEQAGYYSGSTGYVPWMTMISSSDFGAFNNGTAWMPKSALGAVASWASENKQGSDFVPQDFVGLNTLIYEPISASSNTLGWPQTVPLFNIGNDANVYQYRNQRFVGYVDWFRGTPSASVPGFKHFAEAQAPGYLFNALMLKRNGPYGYSTYASSRARYHPVLRNERSSSELSIITTAERDVYQGVFVLSPPHWDPEHTLIGQATTTALTNFTLPPVSMRGRPAIINFSPLVATDDCGTGADPDGGSITLKATDNNNKIFFNSNGLNTYSGIDPYNVLTPFDYILAAVDRTTARWVDQNYMIYTENIFPSQRMEFVSSSRRRTGFDNLFWRDLITERVTLGNTMLNSCLAIVSQSAWPLDAQEDFLTRTASVANQINEYTASQYQPNHGPTTVIGTFYGGLRSLGKAGELQNNYTQFYYDAIRRTVPNGFLTWLSAPNTNAPGALYARKHMLAHVKSVVGPSGMLIPETGSISPYAASTGPAAPGPWNDGVVDVGCGEAFWEADEQAGIIEISSSLDGRKHPQFKSYKSKPWYDNYEDFREDIRLMAKDYAIVPEFRMSEHVGELLTQPLSKFKDYLEFPGTAVTAQTSSFYRDYTNSEKLKYFRTTFAKSTMQPKEIRITVSAVKKFNPYKGFYPAQRTVDLTAQFAETYFPSITTTYEYVAGGQIVAIDLSNLDRTAVGGLTRPIMQAMFSPGIVHNAIKSGMAVDYPILHGGIRKPNMRKSFSLLAAGENHSTYGEACHVYAGFQDSEMFDEDQLDSSSWAPGTTFWDERLPFETVLSPEKYLLGKTIADNNPHPSGTLPYTASLATVNGNPQYELMARNFFGETANFYLQGGDYTSLKSREIPQDGISIQSGSMYSARVRMRRSMSGSRDYSFNFTSFGYRWGVAGQGGAAAGYSNDRLISCSLGTNGGRRLIWNSGNLDVRFGAPTYPLPQDPYNTSGSQQRESFTMYSRTTAFGPPIATDRDGSSGVPSTLDAMSGTMSGNLDCWTGHNWSFTPPYYHGEAWADILFYPDETKKYTADEILRKSEVVYWRVDPGPNVYTSLSTSRVVPAIIDDYKGGGTDRSYIFGGRVINDHAMQITASLNLFGIERIPFQASDALGMLGETRNETKGQRWVIKPKYETPMLNFNSPVRNVSAASGSLTLPTFGSGSVPRGMWHQFGIIEPDKRKGIFIEIDDIPKQWLANHYKVVNEPSVYNKMRASSSANTPADTGGCPDDPNSFGNQVKNRMKSLTDLFGFNTTKKRARLGELAAKRTIKEAVVLVPYITTQEYDAKLSSHPELADDNALEAAKQFIRIPPERVQAAIMQNAFSPEGQSLDAAGESIRKLITKMDKYILPPEFDFVRNPETTPIVMYIFEFSHTFDKDDMSYMWQNLAPRDFKTINFEEQSIAHELNNSELLTGTHFVGIKEDIRFMAFKVKQKAVGDYYNHVLEQAGESLGKITGLQFVGSVGARTNYPGNGVVVGDDGPPASLYGGGGGSGTPDGGGNTADDTQAPGELAPPQPPVQAYEVQYNWPYDFVSIVEGIKIDIEVLYDDESNRNRSLVRENASKLVNTTVRRVDADIAADIQRGGGGPFAPSGNAQRVLDMLGDGSSSDSSEGMSVLDLLE
jgi:hypothetical protein